MTTKTWLAFPADYRAEEVKEILYWIRLGESGVVIGGSGSGKSNVAGLIANRSDITATLLPKPIDDYYFFHLDVNGLPGETTANFYRALLHTMHTGTENNPDLQQTIERLIDRLPSYEDSFGLYLALQRAHDAVIRKADKQVIWLIDRFDAACQSLEATTLNTLRSLRDHFKDQLSFIAFTREPLDRLRNPSEFDEFYEIMAMHTCWVRMMNERDGHWVAQQVIRRYGKPLEPGAVQRVYRLCGGLPAFLKAAYSALARGELPPEQDDKAWIEHLLKLDEMKRNCREMWQACEDEQKETLLAIAHRVGLAEVDNSSAAYLENLGWLTREQPVPRLAVFSPLFKEYVQRQKQTRGVITWHNNQILVDGLPSALELTGHERALLAHLLKQQPSTCSKDELMQAVWHDTIARDDSLVSLVRYLRTKLRTQVLAGHDYIKTVHANGYRFVQVGKS